MKKTTFVVAATLAASAAVTLAQTPAAPPGPGAPSKMIRIVREQVKPGKVAAHDKFEASWVQAATRGGSKVHYLALSSLTGAPESWFIDGHDSFEALAAAVKEEDANTALTSALETLSAQESDFLTNSQSIVARYREDLSYHANPPNLGQAKFMAVYRETVKAGYSNEYEQAGKLLVAGYEKAGIKDERWAAYQVVAGMPDGTYLYFGPMSAMKEADVDNSKAFREAAGEDNRARMREINREAIVPGSGQLTFFAMSPKMSYVSKEFASADPDFWTPKPAAASSKVAAKQEVKKP
jgi:hypothetical protein